MRHEFLAIPIIFAASAGAASAQPSFDCGRAGTLTEFAICGDPTLSALDRELAAAYTAARRAAPDGPVAAQRDWLAVRDACRDDRACLADRMRQRITALRVPAASGGAGTGGGLTGLYCPDDGRALWLADHGATATFGMGAWFANGHACATGDVTGIRQGAGWVARDQGCTLSVRRGGDDLVLTAAPVDVCKALYCGARGILTEHRFPLSSRNPGIADPIAHSWFEQGC